MFRKKSKDLLSKKSDFLLLICWIVYVCSYIGKLSYNANINQIGTAFDVSYAESGMVSTFFFFSYGIGQIFNGIFCKRYNIKYVVFVCLLVGCAMNLLVAFAPAFYLLKYFWLVNGVAMSFLWPNFIRLLSETLKKEKIEKAIVVMGTAVASGTFCAYGLSAFFAAVKDYRWTFCTAAAFLFIVSVIWVFRFDFLVLDLKKECEAEEKTVVAEETKKEGESFVLSDRMIRVLICILAIFAVSNNFIKDGLTAWTPDILSALYETPGWLSILLTLLLPLLAIPGTVLALKVYGFLKDYISSCALLFFTASILMAVVIACLSLSDSALVVTVVSFALISCLVAGVNNIIVSMVPLQLKGRVNSGRLAGILNGFCYLGSTISAYGLGTVADTFGWKAVFYVLLSVTITVVLIGVFYRFISRKKA